MEEDSPVIQKRILDTQDTVIPEILSFDKPDMKIIDQRGSDGLPVGFSGHQISN